MIHSLFSPKHYCAIVVLYHTRRYKVKMWMIKTIPFASLISVFSSLLRVAPFTAWFQLMSSPPWPPCLSSKQGYPFPPRVLRVLLAAQPPTLARWRFLLRLPPLPLGSFPLGRPGTRGWGLGTRQESGLHSVYQASHAFLRPAPSSEKLPGKVRVITSPGRLGAGSGRSSPPPAPRAPRPRARWRRRPQSALRPAMRVLGASCGALLACLALVFPVSQANCE